MKLKLTLLTVFCLLLFACPSSDDDHVPQVEVTEDNYLFEGEVTREYFTQELNNLQENDPNNIDAIQEAEDNLNGYNEYLDNIIIGFGPILPPPPPCPDSLVGKLCVPTEGLFIFPIGVQAFFRVLDENGEVLVEIEGQPQTLPNSNGLLNYYNYELGIDYEGPIQLEIIRFSENSELSYTINAGLRQ